MFPDDYYVVDAVEISREINTENSTLMKDCEVTGTPTLFINGYRLPNLYELNDIKSFSEIFNKKVEVVEGELKDYASKMDN